MHTDVLAYCKKCPECVVVTGAGRQHRLPLHPIPIQRPFQIIGVDIMDLSFTESGNKHVIVFQNMFTKWPFQIIGVRITLHREWQQAHDPHEDHEAVV